MRVSLLSAERVAQRQRRVSAERADSGEGRAETAQRLYPFSPPSVVFMIFRWKIKKIVATGIVMSPQPAPGQAIAADTFAR